MRMKWADTRDLRRFDNALKSLGDRRMRVVANRTVNRAGDQSKTQVIRALTKQTGLKRKTIVKAIGIKRSNWTTLTYRMSASGGDISLKYFAARETRRGVSAAPFSKRKVFPSTFMKGGRFPSRLPLGMGGHVWQRTGSGRLPIEKVKSGVIIPKEMVNGASADAFKATAARIMAKRLPHELSRISGGVLG